MTSLDLDDIEETRAYFDHEVPQPYRQAFADMLAELKKQQREPDRCHTCGCDQEANGLPIIKHNGVLLCVTCAGLFYMLARDVLREDDVRAVEQAKDEKQRLGS